MPFKKSENPHFGHGNSWFMIRLNSFLVSADLTVSVCVLPMNVVYTGILALIFPLMSFQCKLVRLPGLACIILRHHYCVPVVIHFLSMK